MELHFKEELQRGITNSTAFRVAITASKRNHQPHCFYSSNHGFKID